MSQPDHPSFHVRLPPDLMKRLKISAAENERSINSEIAARLERSFSLNDDDRVKAVQLLNAAMEVLTTGKVKRRATAKK